MNILAIGEAERVVELKSILGEGHNITAQEFYNNESLEEYDIVFDLNFDDFPELPEPYGNEKDTIIFLSSVKIQLAEILYFLDDKVQNKIFGINALPTFLNRDKIEVSCMDAEDQPFLEETAKQLGWDIRIVDDRVGMITPRIISMIINEACYTVEEGTASYQDIDIAMKRGTNYPFGPFEWSDRIGIKHVYEVLDALYEDTKDGRYKICSLLKNKYLQSQPFFK